MFEARGHSPHDFVDLRSTEPFESRGPSSGRLCVRWLCHTTELNPMSWSQDVVGHRPQLAMRCECLCFPWHLSWSPSGIFLFHSYRNESSQEISGNAKAIIPHVKRAGLGEPISASCKMMLEQIHSTELGDALWEGLDPCCATRWHR